MEMTFRDFVLLFVGFGLGFLVACVVNFLEWFRKNLG